MIISMGRGMEGLKAYLQNRGYHVVYSDEYSHPPDAYIYNDFSQAQAMNPVFPAFESKIPLHSSFSSSTRQTGIIKINAAGRCFSEVEQMLTQSRDTGFF